MSKASEIILRATPYENMSTNYLVAEMLRLQRYIQYLKKEATELLPYCDVNKPRNVEYWYDLYAEIRLIADDVRICQDILNLRWRGYV